MATKNITWEAFLETKANIPTYDNIANLARLLITDYRYCYGHWYTITNNIIVHKRKIDVMIVIFERLQYLIVQFIKEDPKRHPNLQSLYSHLKVPSVIINVMMILEGVK